MVREHQLFECLNRASSIKPASYDGKYLGSIRAFPALAGPALECQRLGSN